MTLSQLQKSLKCYKWSNSEHLEFNSLQAAIKAKGRFPLERNLQRIRQRLGQRIRQACFHSEEFAANLVNWFGAKVESRMESRLNREVCSYWTTETKDDSSFPVIGSSLGEFPGKLKGVQLSSEFAKRRTNDMFRQRIRLRPERTKEILIADEFAEDFAQVETGLKIKCEGIWEGARPI